MKSEAFPPTTLDSVSLSFLSRMSYCIEILHGSLSNKQIKIRSKTNWGTHSQTRAPYNFCISFKSCNVVDIFEDFENKCIKPCNCMQLQFLILKVAKAIQSNLWGGTKFENKADSVEQMAPLSSNTNTL
jgi:hypothetical protein